MEFEYSPRHSPGNAAHLLSPTHAHVTSIDGFASIHEIRRSLSRSPSKPARFVMTSPKSPTAQRSPNVPASPSLLSRAHSATSAADAPKPRHSVKRNTGIRTSARRISPTSPLRRALSDNTNQANAVPRITRRRSSEDDQENMAYTTASRKPSEPRFDDPIKFDISDKRLLSAKQDRGSPMKSSPLKRSDGVMNLEAASMESPRSVKRRSLGVLGGDFSVLDQGLDGAHSEADLSDEKEASTSGSTTPTRQSPQRRPSSSRRTTLQQRTTPGGKRLFPDAARESRLQPSLTRAGSRMSLDGALPLRSFDMDSPFKPKGLGDPPVYFQPPGQKQHQSAPKPHPLSHTLTPSSSDSSMMEDHGAATQKPVPAFSRPQAVMGPPTTFAKSLPLNAFRPPQAINSGQSSQAIVETPNGDKMFAALQPHAATAPGLMSKRHRITESQATDPYDGLHMPDTPSKKAHVNISNSPLPGSIFRPHPRPAHEFGSPSTPFGGRTSKISPEACGKNVDIFGSRVNQPQFTRRNSFLSLEVDDTNDSPTHGLKSKASNDDLPPTPTKATSTTTRPQSSKGKSNSLRSALFGRPSLGRDTFDPPEADEQQLEDLDSKSPPTPDTSPASAERKAKSSPEWALVPRVEVNGSADLTPTHGRTRSLDHQLGGSPSPLAKRSQRSLPVLQPRANTRAKRNLRTALSPVQAQSDAGKGSPKTPQGHLAPPDPSSLSISAAERPGTSMGNSMTVFPPATPTGPRDNGFSSGFGVQSSSYFSNEVDTSLTERFGQIASLGRGEFSEVYRASKPHPDGPAKFLQVTPGRTDKAWAVKKSRKPYTGNRDRQRKMREVEILKSLQGHEHLVQFVDVWEAKNHLYIQTDFYENGNLKDFIGSYGLKGRLDDFRIWKVLLELSQGLKSIHDANFIHLDLKPANIFVDWEGVLKIGDFGLASSWPAPPHLDGEGDREYIGPEILTGRFDKPADIFALGMIMLEIAGNVALPDNGVSWQRLRNGDMSDLPSLSWSSESILMRDESGEIVDDPSEASILTSHDGDSLSFLTAVPDVRRTHDLVTPPNFMVDRSDAQALDRVVQWMICPDPDQRPTVDQLLGCGGVQWVEQRRRAGATIWEGNWGPADEVVCHEDVEMMDI